MSNDLGQLELADIYSKRFDRQERQRQILWSTLCGSYFQKLIPKHSAVLDLAAGYCEFINNIDCNKKYAVDLNPSLQHKANNDVKFIISPSTSLPKKLHNQIDVVFVSNFFEHLDNKKQFLDTLKEIKKVLKLGGKLIILQPNLKLVKGAYWDFFDHSLPITEKSLQEALTLAGYKIQSMKCRFLPYTTSSRLPISSLLIKFYLSMPPAQWILGKQTLVVASPDIIE